jgi:Tfp pilus assembly protein PilN
VISNINLLPPDIKSSIEQKKKNTVVRGIFARVVWAFVLTVGVAVAAWFYLDYSGRNVNEQLAQKEEAIAKFGTLENKAKKSAEKISSVKKIENSLNHWGGIVAEIQQVMPSGTYLSKVSLDSNGKVRADMTGFARTKENIASLRDALEKSKYFEYVDIDSAATQSDPRNGTEIETFTVSFSLEKGALDE